MRLTLILLIVFAFALPIAAQDTPESLHLDGLELTWQQENRCAAAALTIQLSYFDWGGTYADTINGLNPHAEDMSVQLPEMVDFARGYGLEGVVRYGGTVDLLRDLVAGGFPVLVENVHFSGPDIWWDWVSHNRVVMGYDAENIYVYDSIIGAGTEGDGRAVPVEEFVESWRPFNYIYLVLYRPEDEAALQAILGDQWDMEQNAAWMLEQAQADHAEYNDAFSLFNLGAAQFMAGDVDTAAATFDTVLAMKLPAHLLWYRFEPFETYLAVERYQDAINLTYQVTGYTKGIEEMYYYLGRGYEGQGKIEQAVANYDIAIRRNTNYTAAIVALNGLQAE